MRSPPPIPALRVPPLALLEDARLQVSLPLDAVGLAVAQRLTRSRLPLELCASIDAPRIVVQEWVVRLCRHNLLATPRAQDQLALKDRVVLWEGYGVDHSTLERLREDASELGARSAGLGDQIAALVEPLRTHLDAESARYRVSELFATRASFGLPEADQRDQSARFFATLQRAGLDQVTWPTSDGPLTCAAYEVASVARCIMQHLLHRELGMQAHDLVALFFCDVLTLVRGDPPRPLPAWL